MDSTFICALLKCFIFKNIWINRNFQLFNCIKSINEVYSLAILGLSSCYIMWNYNYTPIHMFASTTWWQPLGWLISLPTGVPGAVGLPFFTLTLRTVINNCRAGITVPKLSNPFEKPREFIHESPQ